MSVLNQTSFAAALKYHYGPQTLAEIAFKSRPWLALIPKYDGFGGKSMPMPLSYGNVRNRAATFQNAQKSVSGDTVTFDSSAQAEFILTRTKNYAVGRIEGETIAASKGDINAFIAAVEHETMKANEALSDDTWHDLYTDGVGEIGGTVTVSSLTVTLSDRSYCSRLQPGDTIEFSTGGTKTAALRATTEPARVTAVDPSLGTITIHLNDASGATGDYIFHYGDRQDAAITAHTEHKKLSGFDAWVPSSSPSSAAFFGVDRTADAVRLGGVRYDGSALSNEEALINGHLELSMWGGADDLGAISFMNPRNGRGLIHELGSKKEYTEVMSPTGSIGFKALRVYTPMGESKVVLDRACPIDRARMVTPSTWKLCSAGGILQFLEFDDNKILRLNDNDQYEFRLGHYAQAGCSAPGLNASVALPAAA